jgi:hypothetical protein
MRIFGQRLHAASINFSRRGELRETRRGRSWTRSIIIFLRQQ